MCVRAFLIGLSQNLSFFSCLICGRRRVVVTRHPMICLVLSKVFVSIIIFILGSCTSHVQT